MNTFVSIETVEIGTKEIEVVSEEQNTKDIKDMIQEFISRFGFEKLPRGMGEIARGIYRTGLPRDIKIHDNNVKLYTKEGTLICNGYDRIVIGDYGAYIEFNAYQIEKDNFKLKEGEEYRITKEYINKVRHFIYTLKDNSKTIIKFQTKRVQYADFMPRKFYVSVYDVMIK